MAVVMWLTFTLNEILQIDAFGFTIDAKYAIYFVSQFSVGFTSYVLYITSYVLLLELTVGAHHTKVSNVNLYLYVFGEIIALVVAYLAKDWHIIDWFLAAYSFVIVVLLIFVLPESPRYLVTKNKHNEAYKVLEKIAKINGTLNKLPNEQDFMLQLKGNKEENLNSEKITFQKIQENSLTEGKSIQSKKMTPKKQNELIKFLLNPKFNLVVTMILSYCWISVSLTFYGVSLGKLRKLI